MGELRLPPRGGDAALQHYLNFVQVFNQIKIALLRDVCFCLSAVSQGSSAIA